MIRLTCPGCEKAFKVDGKHAGRTVACPACKTPMKVPSFTTNPAASNEMPRPAKEVEADVEEQEEAAEKPRDKKKSKPALKSVEAIFSKSSKGTWGLIAGGAGLLSFCVLCGCCGFIGRLEQRKIDEANHLAQEQAKQDLADARALWETGNKAAAVTKYKAVLRGRYLEGEGPTIYQRVIEFEAEQGNTSAAKALIEEADRQDIALALNTPKAKEVMAQFRQERQNRETAALAKKKQQEELALAEKKQLEEKIAANQAKKIAAKWEGIPNDQVQFINVVESFYEPYRSAPNELKKSALRADRRSAIGKLRYPTKEVSDWIGTLQEMGTNSDGEAHIAIKLEGSRNIIIKTWNNSFSDLADGTLIKNGSELYNRIADLSRGKKVRFSGFLLPDTQRDQIRESSLTERGSMLDPAFLMRFQDVKMR